MKRARRGPSHRLWLVAVLGVALGEAQARTDRLLHEPIPESVYRQTFVAQGGEAALPGAQVGSTPAGVRPGGSPAGTPAPGGEASAPDQDPAGGSSFSPDRDTRRPDMLPYDDPFEPSVVPYKRLHAYDSLDESYTLIESGRPARSIAVERAADGDTSFRAVLEVRAEAGRPLRLPSVGPGAKLNDLQVTRDGVPQEVSLHADSADNWSLVSPQDGTLRIGLRTSIAPAAFGGDFGDPSWSELPPLAAALPARARTTAVEVQRAIGLDRALSVRTNVERMVAYFRSFRDSEQPPPQSGDIYRDLALAKKGVCRHRAFAFFVTAASLGIPTRLITNEAHAWVEVHNGSLWKRIDLGGAGMGLQSESRPRATPPPDPFAWPEQADRGSDLPSRMTPPQSGDTGGPAGTGGEGSGGGALQRGQSRAATGDEPSPTSPTPAVADTANESSTQSPVEPEPRDRPPPAELKVVSLAAQIRRGESLRVSGSARAAGLACTGVSVSITLASPAARSVVLGSLPVRSDGRFEGEVFVPRALAVGDYTLHASTLGGASCGATSTPSP